MKKIIIGIITLAIFGCESKNSDSVTTCEEKCQKIKNDEKKAQWEDIKKKMRLAHEGNADAAYDLMCFYGLGENANSIIAYFWANLAKKLNHPNVNDDVIMALEMGIWNSASEHDVSPNGDALDPSEDPFHYIQKLEKSESK